MSKSKRILQEGFCTVKTRESRQHNLSVELDAAAYPGEKQKTPKENKQDVAGTLLSLKLSNKKKSERLQSQCTINVHSNYSQHSQCCTSLGSQSARKQTTTEK